jgi:hypothetical protein
MRKILKYLGLSFLLFLAVIVFGPVLFKSQIVDAIRKQINENLHAKVTFGDVSLSLMRSFPDFTLSIEDFSIQGVDSFSDIQLAKIERFRFTINVMSIIRGDEIEIQSIALIKPYFHVVVLDSMLVNYDIVKSDDELTETSQEEIEESGFKLALRSLKIENLSLIYDDREDDMYVEIEGLNHQLSGNFTKDIVEVLSKTDIQRLLVKMDGITLLSNVKANSDFSMRVNQTNMRIDILDNSFASLNELRLNTRGFLKVNEEDMEMDLEFATPNSDFRQIVSLIPAYFMDDFQGLMVDGSCLVEGKITGTYDGRYDIFPSMDIRMKANNGRIQYPDLPSAVENIHADLFIKHPGGDLDRMRINIHQFAMRMAGQDFKASMSLATPISDPALQLSTNGKLNFGSLSQVVHLEEGMDIDGLLDVNMELAMRLSDVENERYNNITAKGRVVMTSFNYYDSDIPMPVTIPYVAANISPRHLEVEALRMILGSTDIVANGRLDNILAFVLSDTTLIGRFSASSKMFNLDELILFTIEDEASTGEGAEPAPLTSEDLKLPANIDFYINAQAQQIVYDGMNVSDFSGNVQLVDASMKMNAKFLLLDAPISIGGTFDTKPQKPRAEFDMQIENMAFKKAYEAMDMVKSFAPVFAGTNGNFTTQFSLRTELLSDATPDLNTLMASGLLRTSNVAMQTEATEKVAAFLRNDDYKTLILQATRADFKIENGRLNLAETNLNGNNYKGTIEGSSGLDQSLDFVMNLQVPISGVKANNLLSSIGVQSGNVPLKVNIGGTFQRPIIRTDLGELGRDIVDNLKDNARDAVQQQVDNVKQQAQERLDLEKERLLSQARNQADEIIRVAQREAVNIRRTGKEAADKIRSEARTQVDKQLADAGSNPIQRRVATEAGNRIIAEADRNAKRTEDEANRRADQLENEAKSRAEKIIKDAEEKVGTTD